MTPNDIILSCFALVWNQDKVWDNMKPNEIIKILLYCHSRGWLYCFKKEDRIIGFAIAYRTTEENGDTFPKEETGDILFCPIAVAKEGFSTYMMRRVKKWLDINKEKYSELVFNKNERIVRKKIKEFNHGKDKSAELAVGSDVLHEPQLIA